MGNEANNEKKAIGIKLEDLLKDIWGSLTDEQKENAKKCKSMDEFMSYAGKEGIELPDELLDAVAGGYILVEYDEQYGQDVYILINDDTLCPEGKYYVLQWAQWGAEDKGYSTEIISHEKYHELKNKGCH